MAVGHFRHSGASDTILVKFFFPQFASDRTEHPCAFRVVVRAEDHRAVVSKRNRIAACSRPDGGARSVRHRLQHTDFLDSHVGQASLTAATITITDVGVAAVLDAQKRGLHWCVWRRCISELEVSFLLNSWGDLSLGRRWGLSTSRTGPNALVR